jgi:hypothetical protein
MRSLAAKNLPGFGTSRREAYGGQEMNFRQDYRIDWMGNKKSVHPVILSKNY